MSETVLELKNLVKSFGETSVLRGISLAVERGEFITLLGSSGCGKTTTLRIIAGLEQCDSGEVLLEGKNVTNEPPEKRGVNTVFQNYALFPHMTVGENIAYGLKIRKASKTEQKQAVKDALSLVRLEGYESRRPSELSGGQQQRVAIARALVNRPKVLLLDEPLGALDLQLRRQMQVELKKLQQQLNISFIYITHDQEEAINMSDRIAVMKNGIFQQIGSPTEIYDRPKNAYVARFVGSANILSGVAALRDGQLFLRLGEAELPVSCYGPMPKNGDQLTISVRSESLEFADEGIPAIVIEKSFAAGMLRILLQLEDGTELTASRHGIDYDLSPGDGVHLRFRRESAVCVEPDDER